MRKLSLFDIDTHLKNRVLMDALEEVHPKLPKLPDNISKDEVIEFAKRLENSKGRNKLFGYLKKTTGKAIRESIDVLENTGLGKRILNHMGKSKSLKRALIPFLISYPIPTFPSEASLPYLYEITGLLTGDKAHWKSLANMIKKPKKAISVIKDNVMFIPEIGANMAERAAGSAYNLMSKTVHPKIMNKIDKLVINTSNILRRILP